MPFLSELRFNNNKPWFDSHKKQYKAALSDFEQLIADQIELMSAQDPALSGCTPRNSIYRIYRDLRFSLDKTPYKTHMSANIAPGGKNSPLCGFYVQLEPGNLSMCGGGLWIEDKDILNSVRNEIYAVPEDFTSIIDNPNFREYFPDGLWDYQKAKKVPTKYDSTFAYADMLKYRHFIVTCPLPDSLVVSNQLYSRIGGAFKQLLPFMTLLNSIVESGKTDDLWTTAR